MDGALLRTPMAGLIDVEAEMAKAEKEVARLEKEVARGEKMLSNPGFVNKAPQAKIDQEKEKLEKNRSLPRTGPQNTC